MKSRKLPIGGRRKGVLSELVSQENEKDVTNDKIESIDEVEEAEILSSKPPTRPSRATNRTSTKKDNCQISDVQSETEPSRLSKPRAGRRDRFGRHQNTDEINETSSVHLEVSEEKINADGSNNTKKSKKEMPLRASARRNSEVVQVHDTSTANTLVALEADGRHRTVLLILANRPYVIDDFVNSGSNSPNPSITSNTRTSLSAAQSSSFGDSTTIPSVANLGHDGNQYYCEVCSGFGDVVCCDGCPRVFHPGCVPPDGPSRKSLENDDDPWYCPDCIELAHKKRKRSESYSEDLPKKGSKISIKTTIRKQDRLDRPEKSRDQICISNKVNLSPKTKHMIPRLSDKINKDAAVGKVSSHKQSLEHTTTKREHEENVSQSAREETEQMDDEELEQSEVHEHNGIGSADDSDGLLKRAKRPAQKASPICSPPHINDDEIQDGLSIEKKRKKKKKKKKKDKHSSSVAPVTTSQSQDIQSSQSKSIQQPVTVTNTSPPIVQAIPAFYFFLNENRWKIERALARKHRYFNRLPKGIERNELVAREAAMWWVKLRPTDVNRYMTMSMRDYEMRIMEWKEEKNLRDMGYYDDNNLSEAELNHDDVTRDPQAEEDRLTYEKHERLYLSTSVGSKPFKPEEGQSYNRVLLDLLHDTRFHPLPMLCVNRPETETVTDDYNSKVTIPHFEVYGPVATSVGDECLGCSRGWMHYCPVLQRRIPAIEHRAKLQPPVSSLLATRVGLGLRPRPPQDPDNDPNRYFEEEIDENPELGLFMWRESELFKELKSLPVVPSCSVPDPSERVDEVVQFIEETTAMKVPEPPRPLPVEKLQPTKDGKSSPNQRQWSASAHNENATLNKCGRCRTIIENDTGCVQCRRAQLVINKSKASSTSVSLGSRSELKTLKIHSAMLGRIQVKEGSGEPQSRSDQVISEAILSERWCPNSILPPTKTLAPSTSYSERQTPENGDDDETNESENDSVGKESSLDGQDVPVERGFRTEQSESTNRSNTAEVSTTEDRPIKRLRTSRGTTSTIPGPDRRDSIRQYKKEADEFHKKTVQTACYGILLALMRRDPLHMFALPVTAEGYTSVIQNPIDFRKIRDNVLAGKYTTLGSFVSDARLLCENALAYNPPTSIYFRTARELYDTLEVMQKRAKKWIGVMRTNYTSFLLQRKTTGNRPSESSKQDYDLEGNYDDPFEKLRQRWPQGVQMLERSDFLRKAVESDFMRTQENETAYYGCLAVSRAAAAAEASLAPYPDSFGMHSVVSKRKHYEDEELHEHIDRRVAHIVNPIQLSIVSTWREESVIRLMRKVQNRRLERRSISENGCSRCDGIIIDNEVKTALNVDSNNPTKTRKKGDFDTSRVDPSRIGLTTGLGSAKTCEKMMKRQESGSGASYNTVNDVSVSVRGSRIHGMGLFADQPFKKGDVVAEYIGEYIVYPVADEREKIYRDQRIQDYQFRLNDKLVIDATMKGGPGRYINHNCTPNCFAKMIPFSEDEASRLDMDASNSECTNKSDVSRDQNGGGSKVEESETFNHLFRRLMIVAQRNIEINEEITYDYQFPLELDLSARVPCNCQSDACRGFMNWDLPEKGSNNRALLVQKRGANMRDRIRRLGRPLKRHEV